MNEDAKPNPDYVDSPFEELVAKTNEDGDLEVFINTTPPPRPIISQPRFLFINGKWIPVS